MDPLKNAFSPSTGLIIGGVGVATSGASIAYKRSSTNIKILQYRKTTRKDFLENPDASIQYYAYEQLESNVPKNLIEEDISRHAKKYNLPENENLGIETRGSQFKQKFAVPGIEKREIFLVKKENTVKNSAPSTPSSSGSSDLRLPSASISSFFSSRQTKKQSSLFEQPSDQTAINEAIFRYRSGKPIEENQRYIVVSNFQMPSRFESNPVGETISLALWIILIVSLLSMIQTLFAIVRPVWQRSFRHDLENRPSSLQNGQFIIVSSSEFMDIAQNLQCGAIETYLAYRNGILSREKCRKRMIERFAIMPPIVDMMLCWVDTGTPLPDLVEESFRIALTNNKGYNFPAMSRPLPSDKLLSSFPPPPPPPLPRAFAKDRLAFKSFVSTIKSFLSQITSLKNFSYVLPKIQVLIVCFIIVVMVLFWLS